MTRPSRWNARLPSSTAAMAGLRRPPGPEAAPAGGGRPAASAAAAPPQAVDFRLGPASLIRLVAGLAAAAVVLWMAPTVRGPGIAPLFVVALGLVIAMLIRGFELRAWFGGALSLHQSQSLQAVLDFARWVSPLQERRRFEAEFVARETSQANERVAEWSRSRQWWRIVLLPALPALVLTFILPHAVLATVAWLATALVAAGTAPSWREPTAAARRASLAGHVRMVACALAALAVEAVALAVAARLGGGDSGAALQSAAIAFVAFGLARAVPAAPFAIGLFQVLAFGGLAAASVTTPTALVVPLHLMWMLLATVVGLPYLSRYKLTLSDLLDRRLPSLLARSRRPMGGWAAGLQDAAAVEVTVAIPAYNERERLPRYLPDVLAHLAAQDYTWEVIVADDGSKDGTGDYVLTLAEADSRVRLVRRVRNGGKGRAVLDAVEAARGRFVLIADADGATPIRELEALRAAIGAGAEIAVGSRVAPRQDRVRDRHVVRAIIGKVFYGLVNFLAVPGIGDTQCGFKLLRADVARDLFRELGEFGWAFDVEVLYRAQIAGYRVAEVAVEWHEIAGSKLRPVRDAMRMLVSLFRIRARNAGFTGSTAQTLLAGRDVTRLQGPA